MYMNLIRDISNGHMPSNIHKSIIIIIITLTICQHALRFADDFCACFVFADGCCCPSAIDNMHQLHRTFVAIDAICGRSCVFAIHQVFMAVLGCHRIDNRRWFGRRDVCCWHCFRDFFRRLHRWPRPHHVIIVSTYWFRREKKSFFSLLLLPIILVEFSSPRACRWAY